MMVPVKCGNKKRIKHPYLAIQKIIIAHYVFDKIFPIIFMLMTPRNVDCWHLLFGQEASTTHAKEIAIVRLSVINKGRDDETNTKSWDDVSCPLTVNVMLVLMIATHGKHGCHVCAAKSVARWNSEKTSVATMMRVNLLVNLALVQTVHRRASKHELPTAFVPSVPLIRHLLHSLGDAQYKIDTS